MSGGPDHTEGRKAIGVKACSATCYDMLSISVMMIGPGDTQHNGPGRIWRFIRPVTILPFRK